MRLIRYLEYLLRRACGERVEIITPEQRQARECPLSLLIPKRRAGGAGSAAGAGSDP